MLRIVFTSLIIFLFTTSVQADYDSANAALKAGDYEMAFNEFQSLAEAGNAEAQNKLGMMYQRGIGIPQDPAEALKWYRRAADDGYTFAQYNLGAMYQKGICIQQDYPEALKWYRQAAEQGITEAQYNLGIMYFSGDGIPKDVIQAYTWVDVAALGGNERARESRDLIESEMSPKQIEEARKLAKEFWQMYGKKE
jgi:TPR repeat protein